MVNWGSQEIVKNMDKAFRVWFQRWTDDAKEEYSRRGKEAKKVERKEIVDGRVDKDDIEG